MAVEDLSAQPELIHRDGRLFRPQGEEVRPVNGAFSLAGGFLFFAGDPFPPGGSGTYKVGEAAGGAAVKLYPGLVLDTHP